MSAIPKSFIETTSRLSEEVTRPFPGSRKVYVQGSRPDLRVGMREVTLSDTPASFGAEENTPITLYDTSGPYTDPGADIDLMAGLPRTREPWIEERGDTVVLDRPSSDYGRTRLSDPKLASLRFEHVRRPRRALPGAVVTQMHYARRGIVTPEMEYIAIRENLRREEMRDAGILFQHPGHSFGAAIPERVTPELVRDEVARGRAIIPRQRQPPRARTDGHRPQLPREGQHEHRQFGGHLVHRGGGREDGVVHPVGRRHPDGPLDGQEHPRDPRVESSATPRYRSAPCRSTRRSRR